MRAKTLMVQGTASSAGKSLLVTALCRIFSRRGLRVAPFKAQNMALNSAVTAGGHEIGRAQAAQAEAAGIEPTALMNPVLLKPSGERRSQVIVLGEARGHMDAVEYYAYRPALVPEVRAAFESLAAQYDLIILEGAGSPAEINLRENDIANMGAAAMADAPVLLVGDIDRGGVFASLYGTVKLLEVEEQRRIRGFVINKFRGDPAILEPGLRQLEYILRRPVLGVLPWWDVRIDEEDSLAERLNNRAASGDFPDNGAAELDIAVIRLPRLSNFTDFAVFDGFEDVSLRYVGNTAQLGRPDLIILPGSKNCLGDLDFLRRSGLADAILGLHARGVPLIGICGGFQMLGRTLRDPEGRENGPGPMRDHAPAQRPDEEPGQTPGHMRNPAPSEIPGLGLLNMETVFAEKKRTVRNAITLHEGLPGLLADCGGLRLEGYEIHMGVSLPGSSGSFGAAGSGDRPTGRDAQGRPEGAINAEGTVFGVYLHGLFDNLAFSRRLLNFLRRRKGLEPLPLSPTEQDVLSFREREYERLADMVEAHMDIEHLWKVIEKWPDEPCASRPGL